jgi:FlaA1/EpsC-like NDP-sugar epimerase
MKKILIVGAGVAGVDILKEVKNSPELELKVVGFIDDDKNKLGKNIEGKKILGDRYAIPKIVKKEGVDNVVIAIPSAEGEQIADVVRICSEARVGFKIVPRVKEIIEGKAHVGTLRSVRVEDLLGRPVVKSNIQELKNFFKGKKVLVTGSAGSIGSELARQIIAYKPKQLILLDWWENGLYDLQQEFKRDFPRYKEVNFVIANIRDKKRLKMIMDLYNPNYIFHAAAYKHVPLMEDYPEEAVKNNVFGTLNVAREAQNHSVERFVMVSTDKAADPVSVMGATKLVAEAIVKQLNGNKTKYMTVRFGNVLNSYGSVIPLFLRQIEAGGPITITDKRMTRFFMTIPEAAQLILEAGRIGNGGELFVLDMGRPVKIVDLADNLIRLSGLIPQEDIKIIFTGIRPGEKIEEKLFNHKEMLKSTKEEKIFITESAGLEAMKVNSVLKLLLKLTENNDREGIRKVFGVIVKNFPKINEN